MAYNGTTEIASGLKAMGVGGYPLVDAKDVRVTDEKRLDAALEEKQEAAAAAGTNGQLFRMGADGKPEWSDYAAPTDAQVGTAVSAWLDDHPEATTTVEDGAITLAKLNSGTVGTLEDFKAYLGIL